MLLRESPPLPRWRLASVRIKANSGKSHLLFTNTLVITDRHRSGREWRKTATS